MTATTVTVPARVIACVRAGVYARVQGVCELIEGASMQLSRDGDPSGFLEARRRLDATWRLLDAIGWRNSDDHGDVEVDVGHAAELAAAVALALGAGWLSDMPDGPRRAARRREYDECRAFAVDLQRIVEWASVIVPGDVVVLLRKALYTQLAFTFEDAPVVMPEAQTRAGWAGVLACAEETRAALDVIGWERPAHRQPTCVTLDRAMVQALAFSLESWAYLAGDASEPQAHRAHARAKATLIERFLERRS